jgi:hypothetical protein
MFCIADFHAKIFGEFKQNQPELGAGFVFQKDELINSKPFFDIILKYEVNKQ